MKIGHFDIPKPDLDKAASFSDRTTYLYTHYSSLLKQDGVCAHVLAMLSDDARVQALDGKMISSGGIAIPFRLETLAMWLLWAINEYGQDKANKYLNTFLDAEKVPVIDTLWVLGIEVDRTLILKYDYHIVPAGEMLDSKEKDHYLSEVRIMSDRMSRPKAAIIHTCNLVKIRENKKNDSLDMTGDNEYWDSSRHLEKIALLLNILEGVTCIPYLSTSYTMPNMPLGMFGTSWGGIPHHDIFGYRSSKISETIEKDINDLMDAFNKLQPNDQAKIGRILSRLSQAKRREQIEDKILDLCIALEMALLGDNKNNDQLALSFRLRGSWLIGKEKDERQNVYRQLRDIYTYRGQVAHSGVLCKNIPEEIEIVRRQFPAYSSLAENIIRRLIISGCPDWTKLILDSI